MKTISDLGEFGFIDRLKSFVEGNRGRKRRPSGILLGMGDDTAVVLKDKKNCQLFTTDFVLEDRHFTLSRDTSYEIGWKAMARNLSDIAAMGGVPKLAVVALACPGTMPLKWLRGLYLGLRAAARKFDCRLVGGDTAKFKKVVICVSMIGEVPKDEWVSRGNARPGDLVFCTGNLGGSILGKHKRFSPRLKEARFLAHYFKPSAMIDISDGLAQDLGHILKASRLGAVLTSKDIPVSRAARQLARKSKRSALQHALGDGEDFELLFTISPNQAARLVPAWVKRFKTPLTRVGEIRKNRGLILVTETYRKKIKTESFRHF